MGLLLALTLPIVANRSHFGGGRFERNCRAIQTVRCPHLAQSLLNDRRNLTHRSRWSYPAIGGRPPRAAIRSERLNVASGRLTEIASRDRERRRWDGKRS